MRLGTILQIKADFSSVRSMGTAKNYTKQQLDLFDSLPNKPYCMDDVPGYTFIRTKAIAAKKPYIQVNPPFMTIYFIFDDDK